MTFSLTIRFEAEEIAIIKEIAKKTFDGHFGTAVRHIIRTMNRETFYRLEARYHAAQLSQCTEILEIIEEEKKHGQL